jgi:uncharacterized protein DUF2442
MKMKSAPRGGRISRVEVTNVSTHGFWLLVDDREMFLPFDLFPWFRDASIGSLVNVERPHLQHLRWPELDVDLAIESIEHPERYPLVSRPAVARRKQKARRTAAADRAARSRHRRS